VATMIDVYKSRLQTADWLAPETREKAITKLNVITPHIGYPEKLPETYNKKIIDENLSLVENAQKLVEISIAHSWSKWNQPVDRSEWHMPAHMVNAYYDPQQNQIVFPAAILQAPFYDLHQSSSANYGGIGAVIAHEISHAFDTNGASFDENGSLKNWWTEEDYAAFKERTDKIVDQFEGVTYFAATQQGQIKRFERKELSPWRTYRSKSTKYAKLKDQEDRIVAVAPVVLEDIMIITQNGYGLRFNIEEVPVVGAKAAGVKAINLKDGDQVVAVFKSTTPSMYILTHRGSLKRMLQDDIPVTSRAKRGLQVLRELKNKPHRVFKAGPVFTDQGDFDLFTSQEEVGEQDQILAITSTTGQVTEVDLTQLSISERTSNGSFVNDTISDQEVFSATIK